MEENTLVCDKCGANKFSTRKIYNRHARDCGKKSEATCEFCAKTLSRKSYLKKHQAVCPKNPANQKENCPTSSSQSITLTPRAPSTSTPNGDNLSSGNMTPTTSCASRQIFFDKETSSCNSCRRKFSFRTSLLRHNRSKVCLRRKSRRTSLLLKISRREAASSKKTPSAFDKDKGFCPRESGRYRRRAKLVKAAKLLHGDTAAEVDGDTSSINSAVLGLADSLLKASSKEDLVKLFATFPKFRSAAKSHFSAGEAESAAKSADTLLDSLEILYGDGLSTSNEPFTKEQYKRVYRITKKRGVPLLSYDALISKIQSENLVPNVQSFEELILKYTEAGNPKMALVEKMEKAIAKKKATPRKTSKADKLVAAMQAKELNPSVSTECSTSNSSSENEESEEETDLKIFLEFMDGSYRNLIDLVVDLCTIYSRIDRILVEKNAPGIITWLKGEQNRFRFRLTFDGTPLSSSWTGQGTNVTISLLNLKHRIHIPRFNPFLLTCNLGEDHPLLKFYFSDILKPDLDLLESKTWNIEGVGECRIDVALFFPDMKALATLAGEKNNAYEFPVTFGRVSNTMLRKEPFKATPENVGQYTFAERTRTADLRAEMTQQGKSEAAIEARMKQEKSRQITRPLIGQHIDKIASDNLHNGNGTVQHNWKNMLKLLVWLIPKSKDGLPYQHLPRDTPLRVVLDSIKAENKGKASNQLYNSGIQFYSDRASAKFRLKGKHARFLLQKFPKIMKIVLQKCTLSHPAKTRLLAHAQIFQKIRKVLSIANKTEPISGEKMASLKSSCAEYYSTVAVFGPSVFPTAWVFGMDLPRQAAWIENEIGLGPNAGSAQAPENKHNDFRNFLLHTNNKTVWPMLMRHDSISTQVLLKLQSPERILQRFSKQRADPPSIMAGTEGMCSCGATEESEQCIVCSDSLWAEVSGSSRNQKASKKIAGFLQQTQIYGKE